MKDRRMHRREPFERMLGHAAVGLVLAASALGLFGGCGGDNGGEGTGRMVAGSQAVRGQAGARAGSGSHAGTSGTAGQAGRGGAPARDGASGGGTRAAAGGGAAVQVPEDRVLGDSCSFSSDADLWRVKAGEKLLVTCKAGLGLEPLNGDPFVPLATTESASTITLSESRLIYVAARQVVSVPIDGGEPTFVANDVLSDPMPQYSPDRKLVVFEQAQKTGGQVPVYAANTDQAMSQRLLVNAGSSGAKLFPDGRHLLYSPAYGELALLDVADPTQMQRLGKGSARNAVISDSGQRVAFFDADANHVVVAQANGTTAQLGDASTDDLEVLSFTHDESAVVSRYHDYSYTRGRTVILGVDGKTNTVIATGKNSVDLFIGHSGSILTTMAVDDRSSWELWLSSKGKNTMLGNVDHCQTVNNERESIALSADKTRAAFVDVQGTFVVIDMETAESRVRTKNLIPIENTCAAKPLWSPDGKQILLTACASDFQCSVFVMKVDGEGERGPELGKNRATFAEFSPDSRYVVLRDSSSYELHETSGGGTLRTGGYAEQFHWFDARRLIYSESGELHLLTVK